MIYEIRSKGFMGSGSSSLNKYFKSKENAKEYVDELNEYLPDMYFVYEIKLEDEENE
ncbi:hypothetical protein [Lysinibacillus sp. FSL K6-0102]|uniref:hypothetical protein n=1 Tax=Lysinibacillus sp. FSL K6-0102 TaxID=2975290 RepID=UPI0030FA0D12